MEKIRCQAAAPDTSPGIILVLGRFWWTGSCWWKWNRQRSTLAREASWQISWHAVPGDLIHPSVSQSYGQPAWVTASRSEINHKVSMFWKPAKCGQVQEKAQNVAWLHITSLEKLNKKCFFRKGETYSTSVPCQQVLFGSACNALTRTKHFLKIGHNYKITVQNSTLGGWGSVRPYLVILLDHILCHKSVVLEIACQVQHLFS